MPQDSGSFLHSFLVSALAVSIASELSMPQDSGSFLHSFSASALAVSIASELSMPQDLGSFLHSFLPTSTPSVYASSSSVDEGLYPGSSRTHLGTVSIKPIRPVLTFSRCCPSGQPKTAIEFVAIKK